MGLIGFLAGGIGVSLALDAATRVVGTLDPVTEQWAIVTGFGTGVVLAVALYLWASDRGPGFVDLAVPSRRDVGAMLGGTIALFVLYGVVTAVRSLLGAPAAPSNVEQAIRAHPDPIAVGGFLFLTVVVVGPTEELLFRNVVQKRLRAVWAAPAAIAIASLFFGVLHFGQYASGPALGTAISLATVFVLAVVLGSLYEATENLLVPAVAHGLFNAIQIAAVWLVV